MICNFNEWSKFINKPLYNHKVNSYTVYNIKSLKKVMNDYYEIYMKTKNKIANKIRKLEIEKKKRELEELERGINDL